MKNRICVTVLFLAVQLFSQTQEKIPWPSVANSPWPVARGDVQGTGRSEFVGPKNLQIAWVKTYKLGIYNAPVLDSEGNLLFGSRSINWTGTNSFHKVDSNGNLTWKYDTGNGYANDCAPAVAADGTIYFGSQSGNFYALNSDGTIKWSYKAVPSTHDAFNIKNVVLDKEGNIYTSTGDSLYSFTSEGNVRFRLNTPVLGKGLSISPDGTTIYAHSTFAENNSFDGYLFAISIEGEILWRKRIDIARGTVLIDNNGYLYFKGTQLNDPDRSSLLICLDTNGDIRWQFEVSDLGGGDAAPTMDKNGNIFFTASEYIDGVYSRVLVSLTYEGELRWYYAFEEFPPPNIYEYFYHGLVCDADGTVYLGSSEGYNFYAISNSGELLWKLPLNGLRMDSPPVIDENGTLYIGLHGGASAFVENNLIAVKDSLTSSVEKEEIPREVELYQNYPNPFNPSTKIKYQLPQDSEVQLVMYDMLGREVKEIINQYQSAGYYELSFDGSNLPSGMYIYKITTGEFTASKKMLLVK